MKEIILSIMRKNIEDNITNIKTIIVVVITSGLVGHVIFKASCLTSLYNVIIFCIVIQLTFLVLLNIISMKIK